MGVFPGLIQGLTTAATGALQGVDARKERERQARLQLLAQRLQEAQLGNFQSESQRRADQTRLEEERLKILKAKPAPGQLGKYVPHVNDDGTVDYIWQPAPGEVPPTTAPPQQPTGAPAPPPRAPVVHSGTRVGPKPSRPMLTTTGTGEVIAVDPKTLVATPVGGAHKPITPVERETKAAARTGLELIAGMRKLRQQSSTANRLPLGTALARAPSRLPIVGEALKGATEPIAQQFMTGSQAAYQQKADQLLHLASSVLPKGGRSLALLANLRASFTSPALAKNPQAAVEALNELERQLTEVLGEGPAPAAGGFQFKYRAPK